MTGGEGGECGGGEGESNGVSGAGGREGESNGVSGAGGREGVSNGVSGAGGGEGVSNGVSGAGGGEGVMPPPHTQHMSSRVKSASSYSLLPQYWSSDP